MIYKILTRPEWEAIRTAGEFSGSAVDRKDGFIHFSTAEQVVETAAKHFAGQDDLILLEIDEKSLGPNLKWEPSRGGALFPHLYGSLPTHQVNNQFELSTDKNGRHVFPATISSIGIQSRASKTVLSVGQCSADHARISQTLENHFDVAIETADNQADAIRKINERSFDLVLINRILDMTNTEGMDIVRLVKPTDDTSVPPIMLVSNFEDSQQAAIESGAVPGFGKAALSDESTLELLARYLAK